MSFIKMEHVTRKFKTGTQMTYALRDISFEVEEGSFTVILGPSGSGKSTTLNILGGMDKATTGKTYIANQDISSMNSSQLTEFRRKDVGFVFQFYNLIPSLTAYENIDIVRRMSENPFRTEEMLKAVGLSKRAKHFPKELSGGELQRVSIARALCKNPKLLLCDEPTGALDTKTGQMVLAALQKMSQQYNKTVIVVTHNSALVSIANRVIYLKDGLIERIEDNKNTIPVEKVVW